MQIEPRILGAVAAVVVAVLPVAFADADQVGDPLPAMTGTWDALGANFDGAFGADVVLTRHEGGAAQGGIYLANGLGGWNLGFPFPIADRHGCDAGFVNADARLDLFCAVGADQGTGDGPKELWLQTIAGGFVNRAAAWEITDPLGRGRRPLLYDHNGDGRDDLYTTNSPRSGHPVNRFWINRASGFVERVTEATGDLGHRCVAAADFQDDGGEDLIVCGPTLRLFKNSGFGHRDVSNLTGAPANNPRDVQVADLNGDGLDDLVIVYFGRVEIRLNRGFGLRYASISRSVSLLSGQRALIRDLTGDGKLDIYVTQGCRNDQDKPDVLLVGPAWNNVVNPMVEPTGGCGNEVVDAGRLVIFNGTHDAIGPVGTSGYPIWTP